MTTNNKINKIQQTKLDSINEFVINESNSSNKEDSAYETKMSSECNSFDINKFNNHKRNHKMKEIKELNKKELVELNSLNEIIISNLVKVIDNYWLNEVQLRSDILILQSNSKFGRKAEVLELLKKNKVISILDISHKLNISTKNVSSQLTYLRTDGYKIFTDNNGKKMLMDK